MDSLRKGDVAGQDGCNDKRGGNLGFPPSKTVHVTASLFLMIVMIVSDVYF